MSWLFARRRPVWTISSRLRRGSGVCGVSVAIRRSGWLQIVQRWSSQGAVATAGRIAYPEMIAAEIEGLAEQKVTRWACGRQ